MKISLLCLIIGMLGHSLIYAQDYYVNSQTGSNFGDGSVSAPWRTVDFALNGPHAPLPNGSTIYLQGTTGAKYDQTSGEAFPWTLYNNISLIALPSQNAPFVIVDSGVQESINFLASQDNSGTVRGIEFDCPQSPRMIEIEPAANILHAPTIENCILRSTASGGQGIVVICNSFGRVAPQIIGGTNIDVAGTGIFFNYNSGTLAKPIIRDCIISASKCGRFEGNVGIGSMEVRNCDLLSTTDCIEFFDFDSKVDFVANMLTQSGASNYVGIEIDNSAWNIESEFKGNTLSGFRTGYEIESTSGVRIHGDTLSAIRWGLMLRSQANNVTVRDAYFLATPNSSSIGIWDNAFSGSGLVVEGCYFADVDDGIYLDNSYYGSTIRNNTFERNQNAIDLRNAGQCSIVNNKILESGGNALRLSSSTGLHVVGNEILDCFTGIFIDNGTNSIVASNLIANSLAEGLVITGGSILADEILQVNNNTFVDNSLYGLTSTFSSTAPTYIKNCIFWRNNGIGNDYFGVATNQICNSIIETGGTPTCGNSNANPQLSPTYRLMVGSPAIEAGDFTVVGFGRDVDGQPRFVDADWDTLPFVDIGADEFSETNLALTGSQQVGGTLSVDINSLPNLNVLLYAALDAAQTPVTIGDGIVNMTYGNFLLDPSKLVGTGPIATGMTNATGLVSFPVQIPNSPLIIGWRVSFQAAALDGTLGSGQLTSVQSFTIEP